VTRRPRFPDVRASVLETIGRTPLVALERLCAGLPGLVLAKLEAMNPGESVKDRVALRMVQEAEAAGHLRPGMSIVEVTSGNTGAGLAIAAGVHGYRFYAVMSEGNSAERRRTLQALGATLVLVPQVAGGRPGEVSGDDLTLVEARAAELTRELGAFRPDQFQNAANVRAHAETTGPEIWSQTGGQVDAWVAMVGTSGTFTGVATYLKRGKPEIRCVAVEPAGARPLAGMPATQPTHRLQGAGYNRVPPLWDPTVCDDCAAVTDADARETARCLGAREGILTGYTGGANVAAALRLAAESPEGAVVVTVCPDSGLKYLSTDLFA
jgi:cysteine synthase